MILFVFQCAENNKLSWNKLKTCADGIEGTNLLRQYGEITQKANVEFVPYILFNDVYNKTVSDNARDSFVKTVCEMFTQKPSGC